MSYHRIELRHEIQITAGADVVYRLVSDITRTGEWSPECVAATWIAGEPGLVGSQFIGSNFERNAETGQEWRWDMTCEVVEAESPSRFAWSVLTEAWDLETSVWRYTIEELNGGVLLTHGYLMTRPPKGWQPILDRHGPERQHELVEQRRNRLDRGMRATVRAIKIQAELEAGQPRHSSHQTNRSGPHLA